MIHKWLKEGMSKSAIAKRLGISRETVRKYANKPEGYIPIIAKAPTENLVDEYLPHVGHMLEVARANKVEIPTTVIYDEIVKLGYLGSLRWLQQVMQRYDLRKRVKENTSSDLRQSQHSRCKLIGLSFQKIIFLRLLQQWATVEHPM